MQPAPSQLYQVLVGKIGVAYSGYRYKEARAVYFDYYQMSSHGIGRAAGQQVTLTREGITDMEYTPVVQEPVTG